MKLLSQEQIYFDCDYELRKDGIDTDLFTKIPDVINELGAHCVPNHEKIVNAIVEQCESPKKYFELSYRRLILNRLAIFEISFPNLEIGAQIAIMRHLNQPILCLFQGDEENIDIFIRGMVECRRYENLEQAKEIIAEFIKNNPEKLPSGSDYSRGTPIVEIKVESLQDHLLEKWCQELIEKTEACLQLLHYDFSHRPNTYVLSFLGDEEMLKRVLSAIKAGEPKCTGTITHHFKSGDKIPDLYGFESTN